MTIFIEGYPPFVYSFTGYCLKKRFLKSLIPLEMKPTSETISDSAECYAGLSIRFESSAACMPVTCQFTPPKNLQLLFVKTVRVTVVIYVEFRSF